jgi:hypothetical protein
MKIIAAIIGILVILVMFPHLRRGEFLAPTELPPDTWVAHYGTAFASPSEGYGWGRIDIWNNPDTATRRASTEEDFRIRY